MPDIAVSGLSKSFDGHIAVDAVSLAIPAGAFVALLGASGCGKTTLLRLIAGFETPDSGEIAFGDRIVAGRGRFVPPEQRAVGMIFQSYALWPHMTVAGNVAYALKIAGLPGAEIAARVGAALARVGLAGLGERRPDALSGGQRQRVALARALVQETGIVLADEPLANLDAHLRASLVETFAELHATTGRSFVYVTHDQAEALALAEQVVVMERGRIAQVGAPEVVYGAPASRSVAGFIGRGALIEAEVAGRFEDGRVPVRLAGEMVIARAGAAPAAATVTVLVRPEAVRADGPIPATVARALYRGGTAETTARLAGGGSLILDLPHRPMPGAALTLGIADAWVLPAA